MQQIEIEMIPPDAPRHTEERCRIIVKAPEGESVFHTIAGAIGEETLARWLEAGETLAPFDVYDSIRGTPGYVISFRNGNGGVVHGVTFRPAP